MQKHERNAMTQGNPGAAGTSNRSYVFRVSDVVDVPLRGTMLRLRLIEGAATMKELAPGRTIRLAGPGGAGRDVRILSYAATGGRSTQKRLDSLRELDVIIDDAVAGDRPIEIGWTVRAGDHSEAGKG
jgi:hypothetical protein